MADDSLGHALAVSALAPIAGRLADQRERDELEAERQRAEHAVVRRERAEREARIRDGLATAADSSEVCEEVSSLIEHDPSPGALGNAWGRLVASDAVGVPTHDVLRVQVKGKNARLTLRELSRVPAWLASNGGEWEGRTSEFAEIRLHRIDAWVDRDGAVWIPSTPHPQDYGALGGLERDMRGRVIGPDPLMVLLPHGASLHIKKLRKYPYGRVEDGVILGNRGGQFRNRHGLREAIVEILGARGFRLAPAP